MKWRQPAIAILIGCLTATTFNYLGWLQISERKLYDFYLRSRPPENREQNIIIIGLDEEDIKRLGFPLSDRLLAALLAKIKRQNPRVIGLDLHRNTIGDREGGTQLKAIFNSTPQLIGVEKTDGGNPTHQSIPAAKELQKLQQTGASEIIEDGEDGIVRRGYLYVQKSSENEVIPSFGLAIALKFLEKERIFPSGYGKQSWLKLGNAVFPMLRSSPLFYFDSTLDNYQILINYRNAPEDFLQFSVSDVLEDRLDSNFLKDKIVFIGTTAETIKDIYTTPKDRGIANYGFTYGVEIHANVASQIINSAINNRKNIQVLGIYWQYSGILGILVIIVAINFYLYSSKIALLNKTIIPPACLLSCTVCILIAGYILIIFGWWIPSVSAIAALFSSEIYIYFFIKLEELQKANTYLALKVAEKTQELKETHKKLLSQEKLDLYYKLSCYVAHEIKNKTNIIGLNMQNSQDNLAELKSIVEDNAFIFEEIPFAESSSPIDLISKLEEKIFKVQSINQRITSIINEIYNYNQLGEEQITTIDLNQSIENVLSNALQICKIKYDRLEIAIERDREENLENIEGDISDIERALNNIILNAIYYLYQKKIARPDYQPRLSISTKNKHESASVEIKIRDNGIGIPVENLDKIFHIFWTTKSSGEGMGIGLHFAQELIAKHQGTISVSSVENEYTEFIINLPLQAVSSYTISQK